MNKMKGFTLIEVLIALAIIAIGISALIKATGQAILTTQRIKEKTISHWVALQGVHMIQLGLLPIHLNQEITQVTELFHQQWYWRAKLTSSPIKNVQQITIKISTSPSGPFKESLIAYQPAHV